MKTSIAFDQTPACFPQIFMAINSQPQNAKNYLFNKISRFIIMRYYLHKSLIISSKEYLYSHSG